MPVRIYDCMSEISIFAGLSYLELALNKKAAITIISLTAAFSLNDINEYHNYHFIKRDSIRC